VRFRRGWTLTTKSWQLVRADARLLVFPSASALLALAGGIAVFVLSHGHPWWTYLAGFGALTFPLTVASTYLGVAFIALGRRSLDGQALSLRDGFRCANERLPAILAWSLLATAVAVALQALREIRGGWIATKLVGVLLGLAWAAATFFVLPVIALENPGTFAAVRRSAGLVKRRWGEAVAGVVSLGGAFLIVLLPAAVLIGAGSALGLTPLGALLLGGGIALFAGAFAFTSAVGHMFQLVLYHFATTGATAGTFTADELQGAFRERPSSRLRRWLRRSE
jgi:Family of unknown function (DUF6159)